MVLSNDEIDSIAKKFISLRKKAKLSKNYNDQYLQYQSYCISKLKFLVLYRVSKYKKFSNYQDLEQDGYEALLMALKTYDHKKGAFSWWAGKYIATKVVRSANAHSTIHMPMKSAKDIRPFKTSIIPTIIDNALDAEQLLEQKQNAKHIQKAILNLSPELQPIINLVYGLNGSQAMPINFILKYLNLSRNQFMKIFQDAKYQLQKQILEIK